MARNIETVFIDKDDCNTMVIKVSDVNGTTLVEVNKKDDGNVDYTNYIAGDGGVSDDNDDMFKEIYDTFGVGEAFLDNHVFIRGKVIHRENMKTYVDISDVFKWKGDKLLITEKEFAIDLEKHMGEDWYDRGCGEDFYVTVFQEDADGNIKYINEFTYNGLGEMDDHSTTYLNVDGSMILLPVNDKMRVNESCLIDELISNLEE